MKYFSISGGNISALHPCTIDELFGRVDTVQDSAGDDKFTEKGTKTMNDKINLQEDFLGQLRRGRYPVTIYITNGFQLKGRITAYDQFSIEMDVDGKRQLVYKHAVSTIARSEPDGR